MTRRYGIIARAAVEDAVTVRHKRRRDWAGTGTTRETTKPRYGIEKEILFIRNYSVNGENPPSGYSSTRSLLILIPAERVYMLWYSD